MGFKGSCLLFALCIWFFSLFPLPHGKLPLFCLPRPRHFPLPPVVPLILKLLSLHEARADSKIHSLKNLNSSLWRRGSDWASPNLINTSMSFHPLKQSLSYLLTSHSAPLIYFHLIMQLSHYSIHILQIYGLWVLWGQRFSLFCSPLNRCFLNTVLHMQ